MHVLLAVIHPLCNLSCLGGLQIVQVALFHFFFLSSPGEVVYLVNAMELHGLLQISSAFS